MGTRETLSVEDGREHGRADGEVSRARGALWRKVQPWRHVVFPTDASLQRTFMQL
jgi:hypothetical protein